MMHLGVTIGLALWKYRKRVLNAMQLQCRPMMRKLRIKTQIKEIPYQVLA